MGCGSGSGDGSGCRSPHGERGLKSPNTGFLANSAKSLSAWRAWIEIVLLRSVPLRSLRRSPHGERGLKYGQNADT